MSFRMAPLRARAAPAVLAGALLFGPALAAGEPLAVPAARNDPRVEPLSQECARERGINVKSVTDDGAADIRIELGRTATVEAGALEVTFSEVTTDSRCPKGEACVWEGDAVVRVALKSAADAGTVELHTASRLSQAAAFAGWFVELVALDPVPVAGKPIPQGYVATVRVTRDAPAGAIQ